ncbi:MAG: polymer-forming cytoskeletal protein [Proteobacteria bacterium]|nr:polymer-forming cytoskeletal protein [Pseudomonadota bacterium]
MAKSASFTLPAGVDLSVEDNKLNVRYDGDVSLEQSMGLELGSVTAGGDLHVALEKITGALSAGGKLSLEGAVDASSIEAPTLTLPDGASVQTLNVAGDLTASDVTVTDATIGGNVKAGTINATGTVTISGTVEVTKITGRVVEISGATLKAKAISATERITIGPGKLQIDVVVAPEVTFDAGASGRITVIESRNDRGASKIKGGLSASDYEEIMGGADEFLAARGVAPLGAEDADATQIPDEVEEPQADEPEAEEPEAEEPAAEEPVVDEAPVVDEDFGEEEDEDPLSVSIDDLEPIGASVDEELLGKLEAAMTKIRSLYKAGDEPPAVTQLGAYIDSRELDDLRENITGIWNGLLTFHQKKGIRPHHQVTHAFNVIHGLVQEA